MSTARALTGSLAGLLVWLGIGAGGAGAGVILPVDPVTKQPIVASPVTVSIFQGGVDVTDSWLPTPGQTVQVVVNGLASPTLSLVFDAVTAANPVANNALTTSAYPGVCTNFGSGTGADFTLSGDQLAAEDCGGMAVVLVNGTHHFVLPQDSDYDGMPDLWEALHCPSSTPNCLQPAADIDAGPLSGSACCDGIANFDEYRGFRVSGAYTRTHPGLKDLFVHLVNPQCQTSAGSTQSLLVGPSAYPTGGASLFANMDALLPPGPAGPRIHPLCYTPGATHGTCDEWVDNLAGFSPLTGFVFQPGTDGPISDRSIKRNALYGPAVQKGLRITECLDNSFSSPLGVAAIGTPLGSDNALIYTRRVSDRSIKRNALYGPAVQKGLRITECLDNSFSSPLGVAAIGTPLGSDNALIFTRRVADFINGLIDQGAGRRLRHYAFEDGSWVVRFESAGAPTDADRGVIISAALQFYVGMELVHSLNLTPTEVLVRRTSYGHHHAPLTGSGVDQQITTKIDKSASGFNSFYIPCCFAPGDQTDFALR